jgi:hypothetical protein
VGAPATPGVMVPSVGGGGGDLCMMEIRGIYWRLNSEPFGTSALKEGAVVAVGVWSPRERPNHKKTPRAGTPGKEEQAVRL